MAHATQVYRESEAPVYILDFSPPRSPGSETYDRLAGVDAHFMGAAYNPGRAVRVDAASAAWLAKQRTGRDAVFNLSTRDMNKIAIQSRLLGARAMGVENVVVLRGDPLTSRETENSVSAVHDYSVLQLLRDIGKLNEGLDYRDGKLQAPVGICAGAGIDLERDYATEAAWTSKKVDAGAAFFMSQPVYDPAQRRGFLDRYQEVTGGPLRTPVFWGVQVLEADGLIFGDVPETVRDELETGGSGEAIAARLIRELVADGARGIYLVPAIRRGGARDYEGAQRVIEAARG